MNIGINLKAIRENNNKSMKEMADILSVATITYNHYETQEKIIPLERLNDFCNYYYVSLDYIFGLTNTINYKINNTTVDKKIVGERIKAFRKENKITQDKLAKTINTVHTTITNYENGKNLISTSFLYDICKRYKVSADYLLGKVDEPKYLN